MISYGKSSFLLFAASTALVDGQVLTGNLDAQKFAKAKELSSDVYALTHDLKKTVRVQKGSESGGLRAGAIVRKGQKGRGGSKGSDEETLPDGVQDLTSFIQGTYAVVMEDGHLQGSGIGLIDYDGEGNFRGNLAVNVPDPDSPPPGTAGHVRSFFTAPVQGFYTPDEVEEGVFFEHLEYEDTPLGFLEFHVRLMIAETEGSNAINVLGSHLEPSPFVPRALTKFEMIPHPGTGFNDASLLGRYSLHLRGGNPDEGNGYGHMMFYGDGDFHGFMYGNGPLDEVSRTAFSTGLAGSYSVNDDGTGVQQLEFTGPGFMFNVDFLILQHDDELHAHHVRMQFQEPSPRVNNLVVVDLIFLGP